MPGRCRVALLLLLAIGISACGKHGPTAGPGSTEGTPLQISNAAVLYLNQYRGQSGQPPATEEPPMDTAAVQHAGWMVLENNGLTHYETVDGTPGGVPATANPIYTAVAVADRIRAQNAGLDILPNAIYSETISSIPGPQSIAWMWNTVYHRLPLMRHNLSMVGFGDWDAALDNYPYDGLPAGSGYATLDCAQDPTITTVIAASWPAPATVGMLLWYDPNTEIPNPFNPANTGQNPPTVATGQIGPPLHIILPTSQDWSTISMALTIQGTTVPLPLYMLCGGVAIPTLTGPATTPASTVSTDTQLQQGEIMFMAQSPLVPNTSYQAVLTATTVGTTPDTIQVGVSAPWTFTTGN